MKYPVSFELEFQRNKFPGKLIAIEGIDGSGKTTQSHELVRKLNEKGMKAIYTKEPTDHETGKLIRKVLSREVTMPPISLQYLFSADRGIHELEIEEYLGEGKIIVTDRYFWSSVGYGVADLNGSMDFYLTAFSILSFYHRFIIPDITFFLDISANTVYTRIKGSHDHKEIYDNREKLVKIKNSYDKLIERFKREFTVVDGTRSVEKISQELFEKVGAITP